MTNDGRLRRLSDLNGGAAEIEFRDALVKVIENMNDRRCDARAARKINICVSFHPDPRTQTVNIEVDTTMKLARRAGRRTVAFIGEDNDGASGIFTEDPQQVRMFDNIAGTIGEHRKKPEEEKINDE